MSIYFPGFNPIESIKIRIENIPILLNNISYKRQCKKKKLTYEDIVKIEYDSIELPENIMEEACIEKINVDTKDFSILIKTLKDNKTLKWKNQYSANFMYFDGGFWNMKITFKNNDVFEASGDIIHPRNFNKVYDAIKKYITSNFDEETGEW